MGPVNLNLKVMGQGREGVGEGVYSQDLALID